MTLGGTRGSSVGVSLDRVGTAAPSAFENRGGLLHVFVNTGGGINHYAKAPGTPWGGEIVVHP